MDKIEIRVESQHGDAVRQPWAAVFGLAGGTIGRSGQNKLVLPDTDAHVARVHAMVRLESDNAYIANLCERRSIQVDDHELQSGQEMVLPMGAQVVIGPYRLRAVVPGAPPQAVAVPSALATMPLPVAQPPAASTAAATAAADDNPFAFIGRVEATRPAPVAAAKPKPAAPAAYAPAPAPGAPRPLLIPDDFDPFARDVEKERRDQDAWAGGLPMQNLSDMAPVSDGLLRALPSIDRVDVPSPLDRQAVQGLPASLDPQRVELDPMRLFESAPTLPGLPPESVRLLHGSDLAQAFRLPQEVGKASAVSAPAARPVSAPAPVAGPGPDGAGVQAAGLKQVQGLDLAMFDRGPGATAEIPMAPEATVFSHIDADLAPTQLLPMRRAATPVAVPNLDLDLDHPPVPVVPPPKAAAPTVPSEPPPLPPASPPPPPVLKVVPAAPPPPEPPVAAVPAPVVHAATPVAPALQPAALPADQQQALLNAFIEGIGLTPDQVKAELTPEFMRRFGQAYRTAVQGTMDLLHARSEIKRELRSDVTIMATRANNPLKFLPDADGVMMQMVGQTFPGFMLPVPAMQEAFRDLRVHQLALMAGIRAAYAEALTRFDPQQLEKHAAEPGGLLAKLASTRHKAALWDDYKQRYADIRRHAEDDLTAFSGRTFVKAYDAAADAAEDQAFGPAGKLP